MKHASRRLRSWLISDVGQKMTTDTEIRAEVIRFQRTVATCLSIVPWLFAGQCIAAVVMSKVVEAMIRDFGMKPPIETEIVISWRLAWMGAVILVGLATVIVSRIAKPVTSVVFSSICGLVLFAVAQFLTYATWSPVMGLGTALSR